MFFKPEMRAAILEGRKTVTRRVWKMPHAKIGGVYKVRKGRYSKEFHFKIKVLALFKQRLGDMTEQDAIEEGFSPAGPEFGALWFFRDYWRHVNGKDSWNPDLEVYVIRFEVVS
jgi:hypothetical protein